MDSRPQPGEIPAPPLPEPGEDLYVIHYSQQLALDCTAETPAVFAIVVQHFLSGQQTTFAALHHAEREGIVALDLKAHLPRLERGFLQDFCAFAAGHPEAIWLHWAMRTPRFGFEVLAQRALRHGLEPPEIRPERRFDLAHHLKRAYGRDFAPHPRLWYASVENGAAGPELLPEEKAAEAWASDHHAALLWSLTAKVHAIARLYELARSGRFRTSGFRSLSDAEIVVHLRTAGIKGKGLCAALVELTSGRASVSVDEVARYVHGDGGATDKAIRANVRRTNGALEDLGADFRFRVSAGHIHRLPAGARGDRSAIRDEPVTDK